MGFFASLPSATSLLVGDGLSRSGPNRHCHCPRESIRVAASLLTVAVADRCTKKQNTKKSYVNIDEYSGGKLLYKAWKKSARTLRKSWSGTSGP